LARAPPGGSWEFSNTLLNNGGQEVEYPVQEEKNHALCTYLPDGSYMLAVGASKDGDAQPRGDVGPQRGTNTRELTGLIEFSVDGQAVRNLRVPLAQAVSTPIHLRYEPRPPAPQKAGRQSGEEREEEYGADLVDISATRVIGVSEEGNARAEASETTHELETASPGAYWIHASANRKAVCIGSASAGWSEPGALAMDSWSHRCGCAHRPGGTNGLCQSDGTDARDASGRKLRRRRDLIHLCSSRIRFDSKRIQGPDRTVQRSHGDARRHGARVLPCLRISRAPVDRVSKSGGARTTWSGRGSDAGARQ
jgi:hypothetical protein